MRVVTSLIVVAIMNLLPYDIKLLIYKAIHRSYTSQLHLELFKFLKWNDQHQIWCGNEEMLIYQCFNFRKCRAGKWYVNMGTIDHTNILCLLRKGKPVRIEIGRLPCNY